MTIRNVLTDDLITYLQNRDDQISCWQEYIEGRARVYRYEGRIPCNVFVIDETVLIMNNDPEEGRPCECIETRNDTVRAWAKNLIETHCRDAERLDSTAFVSRSSATADPSG